MIYNAVELAHMKEFDIRIAPDAVFTRPLLLHLGKHIAIDSGFYCTTNLTVGDYVHISPHVAIIGGENASVYIKDFCFVSVGAKIVAGSERMLGEGLIGPLIPEEFKDNLNIQPIHIDAFSGLCAGSIILPGCTLSAGSVLGANSLLLENTITEPWTIYAGSPAKPIKTRRKDKMIEYAKRMGYEYPL